MYRRAARWCGRIRIWNCNIYSIGCFYRLPIEDLGDESIDNGGCDVAWAGSHYKLGCRPGWLRRWVLLERLCVCTYARSRLWWRLLRRRQPLSNRLYRTRRSLQAVSWPIWLRRWLPHLERLSAELHSSRRSLQTISWLLKLIQRPIGEGPGRERNRAAPHVRYRG